MLKEKLLRIRMTGGRWWTRTCSLRSCRWWWGEKDELSHTMKKEEASAALDELKKKMGNPATGEPGEGTGGK